MAKRFADNTEVQNLANADIFPIEQMSDETDKKVTFSKLNKQILHNADVECSVDEDTATLTVALKDNNGESIASDSVELPNIGSLDLEVSSDNELEATLKNKAGEEVATASVALPGNSLQAIFNALHPIGEPFVQYPNEADPNTLYNQNGIISVWTELNYNGAFFRASGGNAQTFENQTAKQTESMKKHGHTFTGTAVTSGGMSANATGQASVNNNTGFMWSSAVTSGNISKGDVAGSYSVGGSSTTGYKLKIDVSHTHSITAKGTISEEGGTETRPENYTIKIWKRTA